jgi:cell division protein FtsI/penicillin-binding protein 2
VKIVEQTHRVYPQRTLAAHLLGHVDPLTDGREMVGRKGVERQYETVLQGRPGELVTQTDHGGRVLNAFCSRPAMPGRDVTLALDVALQRTAEELLQAALDRNALHSVGDANAHEYKISSAASGGVILVMDVGDGSLLAYAGRPTFDPNTFDRPESKDFYDLQSDRANPMSDRALRLRIPLDPMFQRTEKTRTAVAPLELLRAIAAVANGGRYWTPHAWKNESEVEDAKGFEGKKGAQDENYENNPMPREMIERIQKICRQEIQDPDGAGHDAAYLETIPLAGKFGASESKGNRPGHAWFAGYLPINRPKIAIVIVMECGGDAAMSLGPVVKRLSLRLDQLGLLGE